ncbi:unnamed protein product [Bursaphelenchus xylophilus]|uniref:(pine wood nematode) hypothetical protein n=1 Tax=Bursaphelenchus xylophilus TaxID=6326 RepID=A0A1I7SRR3_BURXY|nr:unnamed protein product [Bursaphelenchus xylophilus]CAG9101946.1 unnamed protein product [Bursaphelenchus xylophilus]
MLRPTFNIPCSTDSIHYFHNEFNYIVGAFSIFFNSLVIYFSLKQTMELKMYAKLIGLDSFFNICFTLTRSIVGQRPITTPDYFYFFTVGNAFMYSSNEMQLFGVVLTYTVVYFHGGIPCIQFFYRYRALRDGDVAVRYIGGAFASLLTFALTNGLTWIWVVEPEPEGFYEAIFGGVEGCNMSRLPTITIVYKNTAFNKVHNFFGNAGLCMIFALLLCFVFMSWKTYRENVAKMTSKTRRFNKSVNLLFLLQAVPPFVFMLVPNLLFAINILPASLMSYTTIALGVGPAISPLFDALTVLLVLPSFRRRLWRTFCGKQENSLEVTATVARSVTK